MKSAFMRVYPGPSGPHLNCLTETTLTGTYTDSRQTSIHPRSRRSVGNTCKPRNPMRKGKLAKASATLDNRRRYHAAGIDPRNPTADRQPGSMKC